MVQHLTGKKAFNIFKTQVPDGLFNICVATKTWTGDMRGDEDVFHQRGRWFLMYLADIRQRCLLF